MLGLNDPVIAHTKVRDRRNLQAGHEKYDVDYVLRRRPDYILIGVYGLSARRVEPLRMVLPVYPVELGLLQHPLLPKLYTLETARTPDGYFPYFEKISAHVGQPSH
jgi:hypothetical protein